jgi:ATP-dependent DNA helicase DinG
MSRTDMTAADVLGPDGVIARRLPAYEPRAEQLQMAEAVARALRERKHLVAEAGTGVGKSFAYLVPAILAAQSGSGSDQPKRRIVVSTHTISLQEQLIRHDIPFLQAVLPVEFSAVLVKGRGNYVSLRRLEKAVRRSTQKSLFEPDGQRELAKIRQWANTTTDGSRSDLTFLPSSEVWDEVLSDHGDCLGKKCPTYAKCHYFAARRRAMNADLLVVNHALFFSDLALRQDEASILPDYDTVIFDEAHTVEAVAADHLGLSVSEGQVEYLLRRLYNDQAQRGLLLTHNLVDAQKQVLAVHSAAVQFFADVDTYSGRASKSNGRLMRPVEIENPLSPALLELSRMINQAAERAGDEADRTELKAAVTRCQVLATSVNAWCKQLQDGAVYWIERTGSRRQRLVLESAPVEVGPILREQLYDAGPTVVMTSATLATGRQDFRFFRSRIGMTSGSDVRLGSPFDFQRQARLILSSGLVDPSSEPERFEQQCCERMKRHLLETAGRAFVLFTSYKMMLNVAERLTGWLAQHDLNLYCQGRGLQRSAMLDKFRADPRAVLFGTDSFWQGVDVQGEALQNVIIPKLPFSVPDHPLLEARLELIRSRGGNPFRDYQTPEAIIKLKQGFGRLIRHRDDTGRVVILDPRVLTKPYGRLFIDNLPKCRLEIDDGESVEPLELD